MEHVINENKIHSTRVKVSIVMPSLNVASYIRQCIHSLMNQTLREIEIICVDAGSTDGTLEILTDVAKKDNRIQIIHSDKKSYGYQMNLGFAAATGEYIGIVETDDFAELDMFEKLYACASTEKLDVAKSSYYFYWSKPQEKNVLYDVTLSTKAGLVFDPLHDLTTNEQVDLFTKNNSIWSAVYKLDYIRQNRILFNETPGASFQDTAFALKVWCTAKRVRLLEEAFIHYRQDNENSSVNSTGKVFAICNEYSELFQYIENRTDITTGTLPLITRTQFNGYIWNLNRLNKNTTAQLSFLQQFHSEFLRHQTNGLIDQKYYDDSKQIDLSLLLSNPSEFYKKKICDYYGIKYHSINTDPPKQVKKTTIDSDIMRIRLRSVKRLMIVRAGISYLGDHGIKETWSRVMKKLSR